MKKIVLAAFLFMFSGAVASELIRKMEGPKQVKCEKPICHTFYGLSLYVGPHFNYMRTHFNNPSFVEGYVGGMTAGIQFPISYLHTSIDFEGSWNAGPITGEPCQRSSIREYFLEWKMGIRCWNFLPYSGFGWDEFVNTQDPNLAALTYRYNKLFVPIGLFVDWNQKCFHVGLQLEYRHDVHAHLSVVGIGLKPKWGWGARATLPITEKFHLWNQKILTLTFVPFFDWNRFGKVVLKNSVGAKLKIPPLIRWDLGTRILFGYQW